MDAVWNVLEMAMLVTVGLAIRLALALAGIAVILAIAVPLGLAAEGMRKLWLRVALQRVGGLRWRANTYYTPAHEWVRERAGRLRIGIDDLAAHLIGRADALTFPVVGTRLKAGDPMLTVATGASRLTVKAPVEGVVKRVNPRIVNHPSAMTKDPYRGGWLVEIASADDRHRGFLHDDPAKEWFAGEAARLSSALERAEAPAVTDGGEPAGRRRAPIGEQQLNALARQFLQG